MSSSIISYGVVCPGGLGGDALEKKWPLTSIATASGRRSYLTSLTDTTLPVFNEWTKAPRLRRSSNVSYFLIEAARQALESAQEVDLARTGVVVSFFLGCIDYSIRFYRQLDKDGRRYASPVLFPETVFNSPISHVVSTLGIGGPVYSQIGDKSSWATALRTAQCWLKNRTADHVLVIAGEEFDPHQMDAFEAAGWLKGGKLIPSSGAGAILLSNPVSSYPECKKLTDGNVFLSRKEAAASVKRGLSVLDSDIPVLTCATSWTLQLESDLLAHRLLCEHPNPLVEAFTVSAAWDTIRAVRLLQKKDSPPGVIVPFWGLTQQFSAAQISMPPAFTLT